MSELNPDISWRKGLLAVSPIIIFLLVYLLTSLVIGDFYKMPLSVAFLIASVWAAFTLKDLSVGERIEIFSKGAASSNVLYMIWIFILAGAFASIAKSTGAVEATVNMALSVLPSSLIVPGLFVATCFISMAIGTSVGTVVAMTPLAVDIAMQINGEVAYFVAIVLGGAFFGDNLSFISDTTIAATRTQECDMKDKFFANIKIVVPAAIMALVLYCILSPEFSTIQISEHISNWLILPYLLVIILAITGINVVIVLLCGIISAVIVGVINGQELMDMLFIAGEGVDSVGSLIIVTLLAAGMLGIIKHSGGIDFILRIVGHNIGTIRGAQSSIVLLVGIVNLCTANNTVAIITVGTLARNISRHFHIPARKAASLLDTGSCVVQALIPYGAQTLMATSLAGISPVAPWTYLFYPQCLIICLVVSIMIIGNKKGKLS
ncbi:MAG: Na+/H+ antiporter NhaC family protein [Muribaculaceae bacterium]|nr:Na+/H+ antiporter NhaC family protein [Muribaculaceae bacterium]